MESSPDGKLRSIRGVLESGGIRVWLLFVTRSFFATFAYFAVQTFEVLTREERKVRKENMTASVETTTLNSPGCAITPGKRTFISPGNPPVKESLVRTRNITLVVLFAILIASVSTFAQSKPAGVVPTAELQKLVPAAYFYRGQSATVQIRNSGAVRTKDGKYVIAALVDTSGYASDVAAKYQGLFITEVKVKIEGTELAPGQYGFGFVGDKFVVTNVGANDVFSVSSKTDANLKRPVPLKMAEEGGEYRLYHGKKYVTLQME